MIESWLASPLGGTAPRLIGRDPFLASIVRGGQEVAQVEARIAPLGFAGATPSSPTASATSTGMVILFPPGTDIKREDRVLDVTPLPTPRGGQNGTGFLVLHVEPWAGCILAQATAEE